MPPLLAQLDNGGAVAGLFFLAYWSVVLAVVACLACSGRRQDDSLRPRPRPFRCLLVVAALLVLPVAYVTPSHVFRLFVGSYPVGWARLNAIHQGMTAEQVESILGPPHQLSTLLAGERWMYWGDPFGFEWLAIHFDGDVVWIVNHGS